MADTDKKTKIDAYALRAYSMLASLVVIWLFFFWQTGGIFLTPRNLSNLMLQTSVTGIVATGMLMVIISGNIDLSVGSSLAFAGCAAAICLTNYGWGIFPVIIVAVAIGIGIGFFQGFLTAYGRIPAFIVTLGGLLAFRGATKWISKSETVPITNDAFKAIGQQYVAPSIGWVLAVIAIIALVFFAVRRAKTKKEYGIGDGNVGKELAVTIPAILGIIVFIVVMNSYAGIPIPVMFFLAIALLGYFITNYTTFGRYIYAIGGNAEAARLSGVNNKLIVLKVFGLLGAFVGIASIIYTARVASATPDAGTLLELDAIAACVIGGTSLMGGRGTVFGACLGALIMTSLDNGMSLLNLPDFMQEIIKGTILVSAVGLDMAGRRES